jgi:hypothetical protein
VGQIIAALDLDKEGGGFVEDRQDVVLDVGGQSLSAPSKIPEMGPEIPAG